MRGSINRADGNVRMMNKESPRGGHFDGFDGQDDTGDDWRFAQWPV